LGGEVGVREQRDNFVGMVRQQADFIGFAAVVSHVHPRVPRSARRTPLFSSENFFALSRSSFSRSVAAAAFTRSRSVIRSALLAVPSASFDARSFAGATSSGSPFVFPNSWTRAVPAPRAFSSIGDAACTASGCFL